MAKKNVRPTEPVGNMLQLDHQEVLRNMLSTMLSRVMEAEMQQLCGAEYDAVTDERINRRNGYRSRDLETRMGSLELAIPKLRQGSYLPLVPRAAPALGAGLRQRRL